MSEVASAGAVERARSAAAAGDWQQAFDLLVSADGDEPLPPDDLALLGEVAYAAGRLDASIEAWESAHAAYMRSGEPVAAAGAAVRVAMHLLFDTALMAPVRGWLARAERLLDGRDEAPAHAWYAAVRANERMLTGDLSGARHWARSAIEIGSRSDPAASAIGAVAEARLLILDGDVEQGLVRLDEAGVAAVSGDLGPLLTGVVYCELVCALQGLARYDLAEEWTEAMERWCETNAVGSVHGRCRVHRAEILRLRGSLGEAEGQVLKACDELSPYLRRELGWPLNELGRIRLHRADLEGAREALLAAHRAGWDPQPGLALVHLAQGDAATAAASIRDALERPDRVPSKERPPVTDLRRAPLLEAQVEIEIAVGDLDRARAASEELELVAARFDTRALVAGAALARGRVQLASGDAPGAELSLSDAVRLWNEVGAPYEAARARLDLADAHAASGREHRAALEREAARVILEAIGAAHTDEARQDDARQDDARPDGEPHPARPDEPPTGSDNTFHREGDYWSVVFEGHTARIRDLKGMRHLARLLAEPGREFHVLDLVAAETGRTIRVDTSRTFDASHQPAGDAGEILDDRARAAYRRRLAEIDDDIDQARARADTDRIAQAEAERAFLVRELTVAFGLAGRGRRASSASERARVAVTRSIRQAMARIAEHQPRLGEHLTDTVRTGTYCAYRPDLRVPARWRC